MRKRWGCPDLPDSDHSLFHPIPGTKAEFDDCPAYYLRLPFGDLPADFLIDGHTHPAHLVSEYAFEIEAGSRNVESLAPKVRELVHLWLIEKQKRTERERELQREKK